MIRKVLRWTLRIVATLVLMLAVAGVVLFFWFRTSLPRLDGSVAVAGIEKPVSIVRDKRGIPHIYAGTENDAWFALGFVHAQDRLFQMEMQRRIGQGRLAEAIGAPGLRVDRMLRTLGLYRRAQDSVNHLAPEHLKALEAYAAGVNRWLEARKGTLPPEFNLIGLEFEPWRPADTLVWGKLMAVRLSTDWQGELLRARIVQKLGEKAIPVLFPPYPGDSPTTIGSTREGLLNGVDFAGLLAALPEEATGGGASNVWALAPGRTTTGAAILASDPHLGMNAPVLWYLAHISAPGLALSGATVPGGPLLILGHNGHIAWGVTTTYIDTDDVILEKLDPKDPSRYIADGKTVTFEVRTETIGVRFGDDVTLRIRESRNGPALDFNEELAEFGRKNGRVAVLRAPWLSRSDTSAAAFAGVNKARNWEEFRNALRQYIGPIQNFIYADKAGNIGYLVPGAVPVRKRPDAGYLPQDGADPQSALAGYIPYDSLPQSFNPPDGVLINANNRIAGSDYPYFLSKSWGDHYRATRIAQLLAAKERFTPDEVARMQADHVSLAARATLPLLLQVEPANDRQRRVLDMLKSWDGAMAFTRPEPLIYTAWFRELNHRLYADELGEVAKRYVSNRPDVVINILKNHRKWCDDVGTGAVEDCPAILRVSLAAALDFLSDRLGEDPMLWRWGDLHFAEMRHQAFGPIPLLNRLTTIRIAANGSRFTVVKAPVNFRSDNSYATRQGPGFRGVYDFSDLKLSRFTISSGQSGNPYSFYYDNLVQEWRDVRHWRLAPDEAAARRGAVGVLTLIPKSVSRESGQ